MDSDSIYLVISFLYIGLLAFLGFIFYRFCHLRAEAVRKFIHIMTSLWIFLVEYKLKNPVAKLIGPFLFIFFNWFFSKSEFSSLLGMNDRKRDSGLVYYPLSIFILVLLEISGLISSSSVIASVLVMGWGDGLAALIGSRFGKNSYLVYGRYKKSMEGSFVMFAVSFAIILIFTPLSWYAALLTALAASVAENITPLGLDNLTVPFSVAILSEVLCSL